jgi:hypothetical protein
MFGSVDNEYCMDENPPNSTKAYKLFSEGKSPLQVSIDLNLRAPEVKTLGREFWEMHRQYL